MADFLTISKQQPAFPPYLDFEGMRQQGIEHLQALSGKIWTDYNLHDPGVTLLELLCYAITDLGYRLQFDEASLLAPPLTATGRDHNFFTANELLTCNPVTVQDLRRHLIDISGVRNAWIERVMAHEDPPIFLNCAENRLQFAPPAGQTKEQATPLHLKGLYRVSLDLEDQQSFDACGQPADLRAAVLEEVAATLCQLRNLGEDFLDIHIRGEEEIALCTDIELRPEADPEEVLVEVFVRVQAFLAPRLTFYSLEEMLDRGKSPAEIFAGRPFASAQNPAYPVSHGFIDPDELAALQPPAVLYTSDLYRIISAVPGVAAIKKLSLINYLNGLPQTSGDSWCLHLTEGQQPVLGLDTSRVTFFKGELPFKADLSTVKRRYYEQQAAYIKAPLDPHQLDLPVPYAAPQDWSEHYSIHHDLPQTYGVGEEGLPSQAPAVRKAQARQLKAYLVFFDQILAGYLAQLGEVRSLFSMENEVSRAENGRRHTYFTQLLENLPGKEEILKNLHSCEGSAQAGGEPVDFLAYLQGITENEATYRQRRGRFLDHLLARFSETFTDYVLLNFRLDQQGSRRSETEIIDDKLRFLQGYPKLSRDRFRAYNYCDCEAVWDTENVDGFSRRVARLLGLTRVDRRYLSRFGVEAVGPRWQLELSAAGQGLQSRAGHQGLSAAQLAREQAPAAAIDPGRYARFTHRAYHRHGWEVRGTDGTAQLVLDRYFPHRAQRDGYLPLLLINLEERHALPLDPATLDDFLLVLPTPEGRWSFQLDFREVDDHPVYTSLQQYEQEADARQAARDILPRVWVEGAYQPAIASRDRFHFGWVVRHPESGFGVWLEEYFAQAPNRDQALPGLTDRLDQALAQPGEPERFVKWLPGEGGRRAFRLLFPGEKEIRWRSLTPVSDPQLAVDLLPLLVEEAFYQPLRLPKAGAAAAPIEPELQAYFSFAIRDQAGKPWLESQARFAEPASRDAAQWQFFAQAQQPGHALQVRPASACFFYQLNKNALPGSWLVAVTGYPTRYATARSQEALLERARLAEAYGFSEEEGAFGFTLLDEAEAPLALHPTTYPSALSRDLQWQALRYHLLQPQPELAFPGEPGSLQVSLQDGNGVDQLISNQYFDTREQAETAYERMRYLAADPVYYEPVNEAGEHPFTFRLIDIRASQAVIATHPHAYATACERDLAMARLVNLLNPSLACQLSPAAAGWGFVFTGKNDRIWLQSSGEYPDEAAAKQGSLLVQSLGGTTEAYEKTDDGPEDTPYGFFLPHEGQPLAHHPETYALPAERDCALQALVDGLRPAIAQAGFSGEPGRYQYALVDVLIDETAYLLLSEGVFESQARAREAFAVLLAAAADPDRVEGVEGEAGYELRVRGEEEGSVLAWHPDSEGVPHRYELEAEAVAAKEKLLRYLQRAPLAHEIVNRTGAYYARVKNREGRLTWLGTTAYPDEPAAEAAGEALIALAGVTAHYQVEAGLAAGCGFGFELKDETGKRVARHPHTYPSAAARDRALQALALQSRGLRAFTLMEGEPASYGLEIRWQGEVWLEAGPFTQDPALEAGKAAILANLQNPAAYELSGDETGEYSFVLRGENREELARHPQAYPTAEARDAAWQATLTSLWTAGIPARLRLDESDSYLPEILGEDEATWLQSPTAYATEKEAWEALGAIAASLRDPGAFKVVCPEGAEEWRLMLLAEGGAWEQAGRTYPTETAAEAALGAWQGALPPPGEPEASHFPLTHTWHFSVQNPEGKTVLISPLEEKFGSESEAWEALQARLPLLLDPEAIQRSYENDRCAFGFALYEAGQIKAQSPPYPYGFSSRADREGALTFLQGLAQGPGWAVTAAGTACGWYGQLEVPPASADEDLLQVQGTQASPDEAWAWQAAARLLEQLRRLPAYEETDSGLRLRDEAGETLAEIEGETDSLVAFTRINSLEALLHLEENDLGWRAFLLDVEGEVLLHSTQSFHSEAEAREHFYSQVLGRLFEEGVWQRQESGEGAYTFALMDEAGEEELALPPASFSTPEKRDQALDHLLLTLRSRGLMSRLSETLPGHQLYLAGEQAASTASPCSPAPFADDAAALLRSEQTHEFALAFWGTSLEGGGLIQRWETSMEALEAGLEAIFSSEGGPLLRLATLEAGPDTRGRTQYRFVLKTLAEGEIRLVGKQVFLQQAAARDQGAYALELLQKEGRASFQVQQRAQWDHSQAGGSLSEVTVALLDRCRVGREDTLEDEAQRRAWAEASRFAERVQEEAAFRYLEGEQGSCDFGLELTAGSRDEVMARPEQFWDSALARSQARQAIQAQANQEGFHVLEHLLLRPRQAAAPAAFYLHWQQETEAGEQEWKSHEAYESSQAAEKAWTEWNELFREMPAPEPEMEPAEQLNLLSSWVFFSDESGEATALDTPVPGCVYVRLELEKGRSLHGSWGYGSLLQALEAVRLLLVQTQDESWAERDYWPEQGWEETPDPSDPQAQSSRLLPVSLSPGDCQGEQAPCPAGADPYSFWLSVVLPYWPDRFRDMNFRRFVERSMRMEAPAHLALKICWIDVRQMAAFEAAYRCWLEQLARQACGEACDLIGAQNRLLALLPQLKNVYPQASLHDCEASGPEDNPLILNQTALGTANS